MSYVHANFIARGNNLGSYHHECAVINTLNHFNRKEVWTLRMIRTEGRKGGRKEGRSEEKKEGRVFLAA